ncbi:hypothetical protein [Criibacterium bergeronii]|uniref:hypothetical protein n=1 Tax=Criibacterium bergeronii TaxID=1871336 RepID=UPI0011C0725E|nr:hypothetical protein [Criibacterium bergeronii]MBS6063192.1 hypothetical protein [Peptostreptococcaceae bacterium]
MRSEQKWQKENTTTLSISFFTLCKSDTYKLNIIPFGNFIKLFVCVIMIQIAWVLPICIKLNISKILITIFLNILCLIFFTRAAIIAIMVSSALILSPFSFVITKSDKRLLTSLFTILAEKLSAVSTLYISTSSAVNASISRLVAFS